MKDNKKGYISVGRYLNNGKINAEHKECIVFDVVSKLKFLIDAYGRDLCSDAVAQTSPDTDHKL